MTITHTLSSPYYGLFFACNPEVNSPKIYQLSGIFVPFTGGNFLAQTQEECINKAIEFGFNLSDIDSNQSSYFNLPNGISISNICKNASTSIAYGIVSAFFTNMVSLSDNPRKLVLEAVIPKSTTPQTSAFALVRDPIDRFISAFANLSSYRGVPTLTSADKFIDWLVRQDQGTLNIHFRPQTITIGNFPNTYYYDFATQLDKFANDAGLSTPLAVQHQTKKAKPSLTDEQINRLKSFYASDITLYSSITSSI